MSHSIVWYPSGQATQQTGDLVSVITPENDVNAGVKAFNDAIKALADKAATIPYNFTFCLAVGSPATTGTNLTNVLTALYSGTITKAYAYAKTGPVGSALVIQIKKNGSPIWTTSPDHRLTIPAVSSGTSSATTAIIDTATFSAGDVFTIDIVSVGSTTAGQDITVQVAGSKS